MPKTAGIIIIGDEILSGKIQDVNSQFILRELRRRGIDVRRICVIPDDIQEIAKEAKECSERFDYVFTSGGIGPTHDDVTIEAISGAFGVRTVCNDFMKKFLQEIYGEHLTPEQLKMAEVPEGSTLIGEGLIKFPLIQFKNIFILPGIPEYLVEKFYVLGELFDEPQILLKKVYIKEHEPELAPILNEIVRSHKNVKIGSYPVVRNTEYHVMVTLESLDDKCLSNALQNLIKKIPGVKIIRIEG
ncbi:MAG: competence/damage-inducible protein A [Nitrospira sp.]|nr:competence/damage-inducible protein A [Nitrospira sp.]